jgi:hypothetical protein
VIVSKGIKNNTNKNMKNKNNKHKKITQKIILGLRKKKKKKKRETETETETGEERDQALKVIFTSISLDVDEERNNAEQASTKNKNDLQVITEEDLNQARAESSGASGGGVLSPLQMAQTALATLALSPQRLVNGLQAFHTNCASTYNNNNNNSNNSESDSEDDEDEDTTERNNALEEHEADSRSPRRGDEPGVFADAVEGFLALIGLSDPADDATTLQESKEDKESKENIRTGYRRNTVKGKDEEMTTNEDGDGCMGGITAHFLNGLSCRETAEPESSETTSSKSRIVASKVGLLLNELQESPPKNNKALIRLGDAADDATTIQESKKEKENKEKSCTAINSKKKDQTNAKDEEVTTVKEGDGCNGGTTVQFLSGPSSRETADCENSEATSSKSRKGVSKVGLVLKELQESPPKNNKTREEETNGISLAESVIMIEGVEGDERIHASPSNKMESKYNLNRPTIDNPMGDIPGNFTHNVDVDLSEYALANINLDSMSYYLNNLTIDNPIGESPRKITHIVDVDLSKFDLANVNLDSMSSVETPMLSDLSSVQMTKGGGGGGFENGSIGTAGSDLLDPNMGDIYVDDDDDDDEIRQSASDENSVEHDHNMNET